MSKLHTLAWRGLMVAVTAMALPACMSNDMRRFESTIDRPTTVRVVQSMTDGAVVWEMDIPVQHSLTLNLDRVGEFEAFSVNPNKPATSFHWALFDERGRRLDYGLEDLPGMPVRLEVELRPAPEWPEGYVPPGQTHTTRPAVEVLEPRAPLPIEENGDANDQNG